MTTLNDVSPDDIAQQARDAFAQGMFRFVLRLVDTTGIHMGENVDWGLALATVEQQGWLVEHFATSVDAYGYLVGYVIFSRRA